MASNRMPTDGESWMRSVEQRLRILDRHNHPNAGAPSGKWTPVTFANSWTNFGAGTAAAAYRIIGDTVYLRGAVKSGSGVIFTLPAGLRPAMQETFYAYASPGGARIDAMPTGAVQVSAFVSSGTNALVSLAGINFSTA